MIKLKIKNVCSKCKIIRDKKDDKGRSILKEFIMPSGTYYICKYCVMNDGNKWNGELTFNLTSDQYKQKLTENDNDINDLSYQIYKARELIDDLGKQIQKKYTHEKKIKKDWKQSVFNQ